MVFNSDVFLLAFLPVTFALFWMLKEKQQRLLLLTVASYVFYGYWNWRFCFLLLGSSLISFFTAIAVDRSDSTRTRRALMAAAVAFDLSVLGVFKYYDFFITSLGEVGVTTGLPILRLVLPVGISFYTFHTISYIVDVTVGRVRPTRNIIEYLAYVGLFFQLVAGPIVRFRQINADLETIDHSMRHDDVATGLGFFVVGLAKKVIVADQIARYVDPMLVSYGELSTAGAWAAALAYTMQLYFDFSGYSDMAVGLGRLFGLRIPQNFDAPYRAVGIRDFWRRWHISLSTWLRDYLYIPLGGSRAGASRTNVNLFVTFLLGGLWHGANWTFVIWGAYHGVLLVLERQLQPALDRLPVLLYRGLTFGLVVVGWIFFRSTDLAMALIWLGKLVGIGQGTAGVSLALIPWLALAFVIVAVVPETWHIPFGTRLRWAFVYAAAFSVAYLFMNGRERVFLYYQF